jgi:predicted regulator of Ras-like GTPase activity (Roadblock/LC7/MglB family)
MVDKGIGDYFISDADEPLEDDDLLGAPVVVPVVTPRVEPLPSTAVPASAPAAAPAPPQTPVASQPAPAPVPPQATYAAQSATAPAAPAARPQAAGRQATREEQLAAALDELMAEDSDIQAAALVSLDGFTMASALPAGMQADRVGAMSAAILGLGERAAAELGRGHLSQVFIEGENGYVLLIAAGDRAVLTAMAEPNAKLGLVIYDMKATAERIGTILG